MYRKIILSNSTDLVKLSAIECSKAVVINKIVAVIKQKKKAFLKVHKQCKRKTAIKKKTQNKGLAMRNWKSFNSFK